MRRDKTKPPSVDKRKVARHAEEKAKRLETTPDKLIYNAILLILKNPNW